MFILFDKTDVQFFFDDLFYVQNLDLLIEICGLRKYWIFIYIVSLEIRTIIINIFVG